MKKYIPKELLFLRVLFKGEDRLGKYKICVYSICKNEEKFADRWMDSVSEADMVVVVDTGSTDGTVAKLRSRGAIVFEEQFIPWRFDTAINAALDHVPEDVDICFLLGLDVVLDPGWREALEKGWRPEYTRASYWLVWSGEGKLEKRFKVQKIHRRHGFRWIHPVHEVLKYTGSDPDTIVFIDNLIARHKPDHKKSRSQYLPLLELSVQENPDDSAAIFWLGREYFFHGQYDNAISTLDKHLKMPGASWPEERCASMIFISRAYKSTGDTNTALKWLFRAAAECPAAREPWLALAEYGYNAKDWPLTFWAAEQGLKVKRRSNSYLTNPDAWGYKLEDLCAIACYWLGMFDKSATHAKAALSVSPDDERLVRNLELIEKKRGGGNA